jgi:DNA replication ATP-dependent helicase Dna2
MPYIFENNITATELFDRVAEILDAKDVAPANLNKMMHQTLELVCEEGLKGNDGKFGNLFAKVDFLCKKHHVQVGDAIAVQKMRRDTNHSQPLLPEDLLYDCRALCIFISAVMDVDVPQNIIGKIPAINKLRTEKHHIDYRYIRSIVKSFDSTSIIVEIDQDANERTVKVDYTDEALKYLKDVVQEGMQLNLLDCELQPDKSVKPRIIVVEPDFLIDIRSSALLYREQDVAECQLPGDTVG